MIMLQAVEIVHSVIIIFKVKVVQIKPQLFVSKYSVIKTSNSKSFPLA